MHENMSRGVQKCAFHHLPTAGRAGALTSPPAVGPRSINSGSLAPSVSARLFSVDVRDSSDLAACALGAEACVEAEAERIRAKRGR